MLASLPWWGSDVMVQFGINALLLAVLAQGWNIIGGYTGYASFGNSVFYGLGSYGVAIAMVQWHLPFGVGLAFGVLLAVAFALLLGVPVLRLRGHYFAIATLALAGVMAAIVSNVPLAGQNIGLVLPPLNDDRLFYGLALGLLVIDHTKFVESRKVIMQDWADILDSLQAGKPVEGVTKAFGPMSKRRTALLRVIERE